MVLLKVYKDNAPIVEGGTYESIEQAYLEFMDYARMGYKGFIAAKIGEEEKYVGELHVKKIPALKDKYYNLMIDT